MHPIKHPLCNTALGPPPGVSEEECATLPILREHGAVISFWRLGPEELLALAAGGCVALTIHGSTHPPLSLQVISLADTNPGG